MALTFDRKIGCEAALVRKSEAALLRAGSSEVRRPARTRSVCVRGWRALMGISCSSFTEHSASAELRLSANAATTFKTQNSLLPYTKIGSRTNTTQIKINVIAVVFIENLS